MSIQQAFELAVQMHQSGKLADAENIYRQILQHQPQFAPAMQCLGVLLSQTGRHDEAIDLLRQASQLLPDDANLTFNLARALQGALRWQESADAYERAITLDPDSADVHTNLGAVLSELGQVDKAMEHCRRAVELSPQNSAVHNNLACALIRSRQIEPAIDSYRRAIELDPHNIRAHNSMLLDMHFTAAVPAQEIFSEHQRWNQLHAAPLLRSDRPFANLREAQKRLRVGYVSPDLREHAVARFLAGLLEHHDHRQFELFAYANVHHPDETTARLKAYFDAWRDITKTTDEQAAEQIRSDQIDILVDLAGHTFGGRMLVFARKPAPIQVSFLGYPDTSGLSSIDYRLTDALADPPGLTEHLHSEKLVRIAPCAWCFKPSISPPIAPRRDGPITFGCFNNLSKITDPMLRLWAQILHRVKDSRLQLKSPSLMSPSVAGRIIDLFAEAQIDSSRLIFKSHMDRYVDHLNTYQQIDIALDSFPYAGTTTTCEAMWMGVPVITLAGRTHCARVGVSLLSCVGLDELIAGDEREYVEKAVALAGSDSRLRELRQTLRTRMAHSPLSDAPGYARAVETAYRAMFAAWCAAIG